MRLVAFILIAIFIPGLLIPMLFYLGAAYAIKKFSITPHGIGEAVTYRVVPIGIICFLGLFFIEVLNSSDGGAAFPLLVAVAIAIYRGGLFPRSNFRSGLKAPLPSFSSQNKSTVSTGRDYEMFVKGLIIEQGWDVITTAQSGDQGADLIAERGGISVAIQCKWLSRSRVGNAAVQEVYSAQAYYNCMYGCVVTNSEYTNPSIDLAQRTGIALLHHDELPRF